MEELCCGMPMIFQVVIKVGRLCVRESFGGFTQEKLFEA